MDFNTFVPSETPEDITDAKQAILDEIVARKTEELRIELHRQGSKLVTKPMAARAATNPVSQMDYNCRKYALLNIIRNPELTEERYPLADSWKALYPNIPYNDKATSWKLSTLDKEALRQELKDEGIYKRGTYNTVQDFLARIKTYHLENKVLKLEQRVKVLELQLADNGNIWYKGVEIIKLARTFKVTVGETVIETRHGTFDKLFEFLGQIDERLA